MPDKPKLFNNLSFVLHAWLAKPRLALRSFYFLARRLTFQQTLRGMDIAVSYKCNLNCEHCNIAGQINNSREELNPQDIIKAIRQLQKIGGFYVTFTGGEPLMALDKIEAVIDGIGKSSMLYQIQTNGVLLNKNICGRLKKIGIDNIQISFDACHETDQWDKVVKQKEQQLVMLRDWGFDVIFTWLASHQTMASQQLADIVNFSNKHKVKIGLNFAVAQGRWENNFSQLLTVEDSARIRKIARENQYIYIDLQNNLFHYGCPAFSERLHINAYGDVQPCTFFQISFGNIKQESLITAWHRGLASAPFADFPDHCPPAENGDYIKRIHDLSGTTNLPVEHTIFFNTDDPGNSFQSFAAKDFAGETPNQQNKQRCVICQSTVRTPFFPHIEEVEYGTSWTGQAWACDSCGLIHQIPLPSEQEAITRYPEHYIHYTPYITGIKGVLMKLYMRRTITLMKRLNAQPGNTLLDIGCGAGEKLTILRDSLGLEVTGIEPAQNPAQTATRIFGLNVVNDFFNPDQFQAASFDFIRINHVIEHVPDPVKLLNDIYHLLKPGGWLIGETENSDCLSFKLFGKYWALLHFPYHLLIFNKHTLRQAFESSHFKSIIVNDLFDPPAWSLSFQNVLRKNIPYKKRKSSRMPGYTILTILCYPLTWLEKIWGGGAVVAFKAQKPQ